MGGFIPQFDRNGALVLQQTVDPLVTLQLVMDRLSSGQAGGHSNGHGPCDTEATRRRPGDLFQCFFPFRGVCDVALGTVFRDQAPIPEVSAYMSHREPPLC